MEIDKKTSEVVNNVCTILGAALLLKPIIDEAAKTLVPEMQKLTSDEMKDELKLLPMSHEKDDDSEKHTPDSNEIAELKRKLAEFEGKTDEHKSDN